MDTHGELSAQYGEPVAAVKLCHQTGDGNH